ncbi:MAG: response regulator receiver domain [Bacteroidales bacterium]|nr:response regulator receiver domain [Bacteroidales bacterium]
MNEINPTIMSSEFFNKSKIIANDFLQSIVFLDDRAHSKQDSSKQDSAHDLDAIKLSNLFAKEKKICAVYDPETIEDIVNFEAISKKADIIVLDWYIDILNEVNKPSDLEEDAEEEDVRGLYTKKIISTLISQNSTESLKLILVYTAETDLIGILNKIGDLTGNSNINEEACSIIINNIKILVRAKDNNSDGEDTRFKHMPGLVSMIIPYDKLPDFLLTEFTLMTCGLLSNFALLSLTTLRENSNKLLGLFSKELDSAFLSHKALLPYQSDAENLLIELFGGSITDLLLYNKVGASLDKELVTDWIEKNISDENFIVTDRNKFTRTKAMIIDILESENTDIGKRISDSFNSSNLTNKQKDNYVLNATSLFLSLIDQDKVEKINFAFAKLTHHKSLFLPINIDPKLTLGTVIKSTKIPTNTTLPIYYICIQQKCDSVRIPKNGERKFLFIPFDISETKFDILTPDDIKLKRVKDSFSIRTIKFVCTNDSGVIKAEKGADEVYIFKQKYTSVEDEQFEWILDLKDLHSQRIVSDYAANLSRVGLDESEFLRRSNQLL